MTRATLQFGMPPPAQTARSRAPRPKAIAALTLGLLSAIPLLACQGSTIYREQVVRTEDFLAVPGPFRPSAMRVHPLTHTELQVDGQPIVVLHLELKDPWGDTVKGIGQVQIQLRRATGTATIGNRGTRWDLDLRNLETNISYFDSATRTYRIVLGDLPDWLDQSVRDGTPESATIRALFRTAKTDGQPVVLQDEFVMR